LCQESLVLVLVVVRDRHTFYGAGLPGVLPGKVHILQYAVDAC